MLITGKWNIIINVFKHGKNTTKLLLQKEYCKNQCDADRVISPQTGCMRNKFHGTCICLEKTSPGQNLGNTRVKNKVKKALLKGFFLASIRPWLLGAPGGEHRSQYYFQTHLFRELLICGAPCGIRVPGTPFGNHHRLASSTEVLGFVLVHLVYLPSSINLHISLVMTFPFISPAWKIKSSGPLISYPFSIPTSFVNRLLTICNL